jgi:hypothetical protein
MALAEEAEQHVAHEAALADDHLADLGLDLGRHRGVPLDGHPFGHHGPVSSVPVAQAPDSWSK